MPLLFSYGTLQKEQVQLETFGRLVEGEKDTLVGYKIDYIEITDPEVLRKSNQQYHPIIRHSGNSSDKVEGMLLSITEQELVEADNYEVDDYRRIEVTFQSGKKGFIYTESES